MQNRSVIVIGGGAAGLQAAISAKSTYPEKSVTLVRREEKALVPCGIPYIFGSMDCSDKDILPDALLTNLGVEIKIAEVESLNLEEKVCSLNGDGQLRFEKLVIATGSTPIKPKWLKGTDLENVFMIPKNKLYLDKMRERLGSLKKVIVIGAGFIGVEMTDEMNKAGWQVTLVEIEPYILNRAFDSEFGEIAEGKLKDRGVQIITHRGVKEIKGQNGKVQKVILTDDSELDAEAVVLSMGYVPNTALAKQCSIPLNELGFIKTCEYMRVPSLSSNDIFAVGDCAEKRDFLTGKLDGTMLASTACTEARIAGMNLYEMSPSKAISGTIAIYDTTIGDTAFGTAGLTEEKARRENFDVITGTFTGLDKHPGSLPGCHGQTVKLITAANSGLILGGEVCGGCSVGELTNSIGFLIQNRVHIKTLLTMQIGTHPMLTGSPAGYPLIKAAEVTAKQLKKAV